MWCHPPLNLNLFGKVAFLLKKEKQQQTKRLFSPNLVNISPFNPQCNLLHVYSTCSRCPRPIITFITCCECKNLPFRMQAVSPGISSPSLFERERFTYTMEVPQLLPLGDILKTSFKIKGKILCSEALKKLGLSSSSSFSLKYKFPKSKKIAANWIREAVAWGGTILVEISTSPAHVFSLEC